MDEKSIVIEALKKESPEALGTFLDDACAGNPQLRRRIDALLRWQTQDDPLLDHPLFEPRHVDTGEHEDLDLSFLEASDKPDSLGRLGPYEIQSVVGHGGTGVVLKGIDGNLNRVVAIKVLSPVIARSTTARRRFIREAQAAAAINHPNVTTIHSVDHSANPPYLTLEFVAGKTLQQLIDERGALDVQTVVAFSTQLAEGLAAAHRCGLIHRDIKPANILLEDGTERVKITDFGLARAMAVEGITRTGHVGGTPEYMSPEQSKGLQLDARSDLFSLGTVMYAMCTGKSPFSGDTSLSIVRQVCDFQPVSVHEAAPTTPRWLADIVMRLLAKSPDERIQTAEELSSLLAQGDQPKPASPPAPSATGATRRMRFAVFTIAGLLIMFVIAELAGVTQVTGWLSPNPVDDSNGGANGDGVVPTDPLVANPKGSAPPLPAAALSADEAKAYQRAWAEHLGIPVSVNNSLDMRLVLIPPGRYVTGIEGNDEFPTRTITVTRPFYMSSTEVTVGQFRRFADAEEYASFGETDPVRPAGSEIWKDPGYPATDDQAAVWIAYADTQAFCDWLSKKENRRYSLPTEAQWELAARAGTAGDHWYEGDGLSDDSYAWSGGGRQNVQEVAKKRPNPFDLFDMYGNAWEWVSDWRAPRQAGEHVDPEGPAEGDWKVLSGGCFLDGRDLCSSTGRIHSFPRWCSGNVGFRVMLEIDFAKRAPTEAFQPAE